MSHLYIKVIILPRQARDKHSENSKKAVLSKAIEDDDGTLHMPVMKSPEYVDYLGYLLTPFDSHTVRIVLSF